MLQSQTVEDTFTVRYRDAVSLMLPGQMKKTLQARARKKNVSLNSYITKVLFDHLCRKDSQGTRV